MPFFVGPGSSPDGGLEMKSDRVGFPTATSDPGSAVIGDMYVHTVGAGATFMIYDGTGWFTADAVPFSATGGTKTTSGGDTIHGHRNSCSILSSSATNTQLCFQLIIYLSTNSVTFDYT